VCLVPFDRYLACLHCSFGIWYCTMQSALSMIDGVLIVQYCSQAWLGKCVIASSRVAE
jgi:hypothetical protein